MTEVVQYDKPDERKEGRRFEGTVTRVGQAATSEFALLPNPNPSGNFTKITQRLPVRIAVQQDGGELKPGMMVELEARADD
jgi:membrane fusion protein (multidrug efflux system)